MFMELEGGINSIRSRKTRRKNQLKPEKTKLAEEEINQLQIKRSCIETSIRKLLDSVDRLALQAEKEHKMELLVKSNAFRKSAQAKQTEITRLDKDVGQKRDDLKRT